MSSGFYYDSFFVQLNIWLCISYFKNMEICYSLFVTNF